MAALKAADKAQSLVLFQHLSKLLEGNGAQNHKLAFDFSQLRPSNGVILGSKLCPSSRQL